MHTNPAGGRYVGAFEDGEYHGSGSYTYVSGVRYEGEWENGLIQHGVVLHPSGARYKGSFELGKMHGFGEWTHPPEGTPSAQGPGGPDTMMGGLYVGGWVAGKKAGLGMYIDPMGLKYEGEWQENQQHGVGVWLHPSGSKYSGDMVLDAKEGCGVWVHSAGVVYKGHFVKNKKNGHGVWKHGDRNELYYGEFKDNAKHGRGVSVYADGSMHEGVYKKGKKSGYGVWTSAPGWIFAASVTEGKWRNDENTRWLSGGPGEGEKEAVKARLAMSNALKAEVDAELAENNAQAKAHLTEHQNQEGTKEKPSTPKEFEQLKLADGEGSFQSDEGLLD
jgi:hypothetical protein